MFGALALTAIVSATAASGPVAALTADNPAVLTFESPTVTVEYGNSLTLVLSKYYYVPQGGDLSLTSSSATSSLPISLTGFSSDGAPIADRVLVKLDDPLAFPAPGKYTAVVSTTETFLDFQQQPLVTPPATLVVTPRALTLSAFIEPEGSAFAIYSGVEPTTAESDWTYVLSGETFFEIRSEADTRVTTVLSTGECNCGTWTPPQPGTIYEITTVFEPSTPGNYTLTSVPYSFTSPGVRATPSSTPTPTPTPTATPKPSASTTPTIDAEASSSTGSVAVILILLVVAIAGTVAVILLVRQRALTRGALPDGANQQSAGAPPPV